MDPKIIRWTGDISDYAMMYLNKSVFNCLTFGCHSIFGYSLHKKMKFIDTHMQPYVLGHN
jgi:hypothetical protein